MDIEKYLSKIDGLNWRLVSPETWEAIQIEGLDEEMDQFCAFNWYEAILPISDADAASLMAFSDEAIEKFNIFDIELKLKYNDHIVDLIDYSAGIVRLVRIK